MSNEQQYPQKPREPENTYQYPQYPQPQQPQYPQQYYPFHYVEQNPYGQDNSAFKNKSKSKIVPGIVALSLISALVGGGVGGGVVALNDGGSSYSSTSASKVDTASEVTTSDLSKTINEKLASVVTISVVDSQAAGTGSGVVMNDNGYIITNAHVATLEGQTDQGKITVQTSTGDDYSAQLVGYDATADLAVLKIDKNAKGIKPITFASSDKLQVGTQAIAIGSPLGLSGTVTTGIVSALNRPISVQSSQVNADNSGAAQNTVSLSAIQTDAAINQGNSGGALLDGSGNLIGINVAIASTKDSTGSIGVGFAIPSDYAKRIAQELIDNGKATHGYLGTSISDYGTNGSAFTTGAQVKEVNAGSAAQKAGLRSGDIITKVNDTPVDSATQLTAIIKQEAPGTNVKVTYTRNGQENTTSVTLGDS